MFSIFFCFHDFYLHIFREPIFCEIATFHTSNLILKKRIPPNFLTGFLPADWTNWDIWYNKLIQNLIKIATTRHDFPNFACHLNNKAIMSMNATMSISFQTLLKKECLWVRWHAMVYEIWCLIDTNLCLKWTISKWFNHNLSFVFLGRRY